jgi:hypothetical protein
MVSFLCDPEPNLKSFNFFKQSELSPIKPFPKTQIDRKNLDNKNGKFLKNWK